jgi:hypothetical protein
MTASQPDEIDFTRMYLTHNALRRDIGRLTAAAPVGRYSSAPVLASMTLRRFSVLRVRCGEARPASPCCGLDLR